MKSVQGRRLINGWKVQLVVVFHTYEAANPMHILFDVFIHCDVNEEREMTALSCCKTQHYYPSSPLPRTLQRSGNRMEQDDAAKTKIPGNYECGTLTWPLPPFNIWRDSSYNFQLPSFIFHSQAPIVHYLYNFFFIKYISFDTLHWIINISIPLLSSI